MTMSMIEKISKALCELYAPYPTCRWPTCSCPVYANAILDAMRKPSDGMVDAMETTADYRFEASDGGHTSIGITKETCSEIYTAMIDAGKAGL